MILNNFKTVLSVFAHPDDETLAAGATLSILNSMGASVYVAVPSIGAFSRQNEMGNQNSYAEQLKHDCRSAMSVLGVKESNIFFGDFPDNEMDKHTLLRLVQWVENIIREVKPDLILTHHRYCTNIDHQYCHEAVVVATRPSENQHITVLCGEIPSSTGYLRPAQWEPNYYVEVNESHLSKKVAAMELYDGEKRPDPHPRSKEVLYALAKVRGSEAGFFYAESFMIQKTFCQTTHNIPN